ncbi:Aminoacyl Trna Synthase Complex-Interacting Multifunctional Protein 1, partial [Manis pentadactyla]
PARRAARRRVNGLAWQRKGSARLPRCSFPRDFCSASWAELQGFRPSARRALDRRRGRGARGQAGIQRAGREPRAQLLGPPSSQIPCD